MDTGVALNVGAHATPAFRFVLATLGAPAAKCLTLSSAISSIIGVWQRAVCRGGQRMDARETRSQEGLQVRRT